MQTKKETAYLNPEEVEKSISNYAPLYSLLRSEESKKAAGDYITHLIQQVENPQEKVRLQEVWRLETEIITGKNLEKILNVMELFAFDGSKKRIITSGEDKKIKRYINEFIPKSMTQIYFKLWEAYKDNHKTNKQNE